MSSVAQWLVDKNLPIGVEQVITNQCNRNRLLQLTTDVLSAQPLLQFTEWKNHFAVRRNYLSIDDHISGQRSKRLNQLGKPVRDFIHRPRVDRYSPRLYMCLSAYAVKLVFN